MSTDGRLAERERLPGRGYNRRTFTWLGPDSVRFQDVNPSDVPSPIGHVMVVRDGNVLRQYGNDETGQFGYSDYEYMGLAAIRPTRTPPRASLYAIAGPRDLLGRRGLTQRQ